MRTKTGLAGFLCVAWAWAAPGLAQEHDSSPVTGSPGEPDGATPVRDGCPTFSWGAFEGATGFQLAVSGVSGDHPVKSRPVLERRLPAALHSWTPSAAACLAPGRYAWAVRARTGDGWSGWSKPRLFEVRAGRSTPPVGTFTQVSAGLAHSCGVKSDGTAACWGDNGSGQSSPPAGTFTQVSAGGVHTCGVKSDGTAACWGLNSSNQSTPPAGTFTQVSAGLVHTCGVKSDGTAACWGSNGSGQTAPPPRFP